MRLFKEINVSDLFLTDLENTIIKTSKSPNKVKGVHYKPSALNCLRQMFYYRTSTEIDEVVNRPASSIGILHSGEDRHKRIQEAIYLMKDNGYDCEWVDVEQYVKDKNLTHIEVVSKKQFETCCKNKELDLLFLCDGLIKYKDKYYIVEIKTENSKSFFNRQSVSEEHKRQAICYSISFNINSVIFIYENRDLCLKRCFLFNVTAEMKQSVIDLIHQCDNYVLKNEVPKVVEHKHCSYCDYRKRCKQEVDNV